jgi:hypothetical protein
MVRPLVTTRSRYIVDAAAIWYFNDDEETVRAEPDEVVELTPSQARHFKKHLRPFIPEDEALEEDLDEEAVAPPQGALEPLSHVMDPRPASSPSRRRRASEDGEEHAP